MKISNKLFLITALSLSIGSHLNAYADSQETNQNIFNFAIALSKQENNNAKAVSYWLLREIGNDNFNTNKILLVINSPLTIEEKIEYLSQLRPNPIKKYAVSTLSTINSVIKKSLTLTAAIAAPAIIVISMDIGRQIAKQIKL